ncbi:MAG: hypothetical protein QOF41_435 [Methylobacteriaceae bacterium]|nr:hypothetical protein [Methylobacteriaceae bacterium]
MMRRSLATFSTILGIVSSAAAQPSGPQRRCSDFGFSAEGAMDGQTYYKSDFGWSLLTTRISDLRISQRGVVQMLYVVKADPARTSSGMGVVVVKTGRVPASDVASTQNVKLVRKTAIKDGLCAAPRPFEDTSLPADVYDGYHDYGRTRYSKAALQTLQDFHMEFGPNCRRTDHDPGGLYRHVSNRASFSYSTDVVDVGGYTGFEAAVANLNFGRAARAQAAQAERPYGDRRTEIKQYATAGGVACVQIDVPVSDRGSFLRINDLSAPIVDGTRERRY